MLPVLLAAVAAEALFAPFAPGAALPGGWTWAVTRHKSDGAAEIILAGPQGAAATLVAAPRREGGAYAKSAHHDLFFQGRDVPAALKPAVEALAARMLANDPGEKVAGAGARGPPGWLLNWLARFALILCAAGAGWGMRRAWRERSETGARSELPSRAGLARAGPAHRVGNVQAATDIAALFLAALAWRIAWSPAAFLHENFYAGYLLAATADPPARQVYGNGWFALVHDLRALFGPSPSVIFVFTLILAALAAPALAALAWALTRDRLVALAAGALYAVWPAHVRYSMSEDMHVALTPFALAGLALLVERARGAAAWSAIAGAASLSLAMMMRPVELALPVVAALAVLAVAGKAALRDRALWLAAGLVAVLCGPSAWNVATAEDPTVFSWVTSPRLAVQNLAHSTAFLDAAITPRALPLLAAGGAVLGLWRLRALAVPALGGALLFGYLYLGIHLVPSAARLQLSYQPYLALLAALGGAAILRAVPRPLPRALTAAALLAAAALPALPYVRATHDQQDEWRFLAAAVPRLPPGTIVALDGTEGAPILPALTPAALAALGRPGAVAPLSFALSAAAPADLVYYRGLSCALRHVDQPERAAHPLCDAVEKRWFQEPIATARVAARPFTGYTRYPEGTREVEIGFFRLRPPAVPTDTW